MKVLIVGSGAREHALALLAVRSVYEPRMYAVSDHPNPGIAKVCESSGGRIVIAKTTDPESVVKAAEHISPDLIVIGPEEPQFAGVVDALRDRGFTVFGATRRCAEIEKSKVFARMLMWRYDIPGRLFFKAFTSVEDALRFLEYAGDVVIKPARQAGGKGVKVLSDLRAYLRSETTAMKKIFAERVYRDVVSKYKDIEYKILVEQRVEGVEYTVMAITDGSTVLALPAVQDHPHAFEFDLGPETGGMGSISGPGWTLPFITVDEYAKSVEIVEKVVEALGRELGEPYVGAIAGQMMLTGIWGPTVIEFYSRFGDPELANILPIAESDFLELLDRAARRKLASAKLVIKEDVAVVVKAVAPAGYPEDKKAARGHKLLVDEEKIREQGCVPLYGSVELNDGVLRTLGSRALEVVCTGSTHEEAAKRADRAITMGVESLDGWPLFYRRDIGSKQLLQSRAKLAERVRRVYRYREKNGLLGKIFVWIPGEGIYVDPLLPPIPIRGD